MQVAGKGATLNPYGIKPGLSVNVFAGTSKNRSLDWAMDGEGPWFVRRITSVRENSIFQHNYMESEKC